jgi:hypothetical protein
VAKPLLDAAAKARATSAPPPPGAAAGAAQQGGLSLEAVGALLSWRQQALVAELAGAMGAGAARGGAQGAADAFEQNLDRVVRRCRHWHADCAAFPTLSSV